MGWAVETRDGLHEGHVALLAPDGRASGSSNGQGIFLRNPRWTYDSKEEPFDILVPWSEVAGWRVQCECGWRGTAWLRGEGVSPDDPAEEDVYPEHMLLPDGRSLEEAGHEEWKRHVQPLAAAEVVRTAAHAVREAEEALAEAVAAARAGNPPATWDQIGRAVGITRQSAHDRWAR